MGKDNGKYGQEIALWSQILIFIKKMLCYLILVTISQKFAKKSMLK